MPEIRPVTKDNWRELAKLKVLEDQRHFVAPNSYSIAESHYGFDHPEEGHWDMVPYGMYDDDKPVGFLMLGYNYSNSKTQGYVVRLMVAGNFQGKGFGRFGMNWILEHYRADPAIKTIGISYEPENEVARKLYASLGFVETGEIFEGETVAELKLR